MFSKACSVSQLRCLPTLQLLPLNSFKLILLVRCLPAVHTHTPPSLDRRVPQSTVGAVPHNGSADLTSNTSQGSATYLCLRVCVWQPVRYRCSGPDREREWSPKLSALPECIPTAQRGCHSTQGPSGRDLSTVTLCALSENSGLVYVSLHSHVPSHFHL